jgi:polar amino acid transport system substrate-binding protein
VSLPDTGARRERTPILAIVLLLLSALLPSYARAAAPDAALSEVLDQARAATTVAGACARPDADRLVQTLCSGRLRIGVRRSYPLFSDTTDDKRAGFEIDIARAITARLGVAAEFVNVEASNRIALLAEGKIDLVIAEMGDTVQRALQVRFIRPHFYRSRTVLVGPRDARTSGWDDMNGRTVCVTVGNGSNARMLSHGTRLMLFDTAQALPERLTDGTCAWAAQDDSFFAYYLTNPDFNARFAAKFGFSEVPWGMGVARTGSEKLGRALDLISQIFHRDGVFLTAAQANRVDPEFLAEQKSVWTRPDCDTDSATTNPDCILPSADVSIPATSFADTVTTFETWVENTFGLTLILPMLKTQPAWSLFLDGVTNSLILIVATLVVTMVFAVLFGRALGSEAWPLRWLARGVTVVLQSSPILLTLVITASVLHAIVPYSARLDLGAAIVALGLANGSNAGQAISEAYLTFQKENANHAISNTLVFRRALRRSATQIMSFMINAAKGTPIASFIGAPELLNALTDISSFASGRATTYSLLLIFYTAVVIVVVWLMHRFQAFLERDHHPA